MARIDHHGREDGHDVAVEVLGDRCEIRIGELVAAHVHEALLGEAAAHQVVGLLVAGDHGGKLGEDGVELAVGREAGARVERRLLEGGEVGEAAHAHHEPLVEVGAEDLDELHALEERDALIEGLVEHAVVEAQPRELAVLRERDVLLGLGLGGLLLLGGLCGLRLLLDDLDGNLLLHRCGLLALLPLGCHCSPLVRVVHNVSILSARYNRYSALDP